MRWPRLASAPGLFLALVVILPGALAQHDHDPAPSASQQQVSNLFNLIMIPALIIGALVFILTIDAMVLFRRGRRRRRRVSRFTEHRLLEVLWTLAPALVLVMIALLTIQTLQAVEYAPQGSVNVRVIGQQWAWSFQYLRPDLTNASDPVQNTLAVPVNEVVNLYVVSRDVIHSFFVPALYLKIDAVPSHVNHFWFQAQAPGNYTVECAEFCGTGHGLMRAQVYVFGNVTQAPATYPFRPGYVPPPHSPAGNGTALTGPVVAPQQASNGTTIDLHLKTSGCTGGESFCIDPATVPIPLNGEITLRVWDDGDGHNFTFDPAAPPFAGLKHDPLIPHGQFILVNLSAAQTQDPWRVQYYCNVPGHRQAGMQGTLVIGDGSKIPQSFAGPAEIPIVQYMIFGTMATAAVLVVVYHFRSIRRRRDEGHE